ncbi:MAG: DnaJ domain-containing protein, partial [Acidobacteriota bacterium]
RGSMFLKASTQPPIGTLVRIDLELPSATVIELSGVIVKHVVDPQRGTGVDLSLEPLPTKSVWLIESALAAESKVRAASQPGAPEAPMAKTSSGPVRVDEGGDLAAAEEDLLRALDAEAESLRKLNPFLVLGVGYETTDGDVRAAFGELTKRYHPDRFARYQSQKLKQTAAEIFILIRDAYRRLSDAAGRQQVLAQIGPRVPQRAQTEPRGSGPVKRPPITQPRIAVPPPPPRDSAIDLPTKQAAKGPHDAPTNPSAKTAELAHTELAKGGDELAVPVVKQGGRAPASVVTPSRGVPTGPMPATPSAPVDPGDVAALEALIDDGKLDEALSGYRILAKKHPQEKAYRAGMELCEGLRALGQRDRLEAAQRFEAALELDPSNERAARELADMRRQATNERKGLLSRLMGKKEPPT